MKTKHIFLRFGVIVLFAAGILFTAVSCNDAEPVILDLPSDEGGIGRDKEYEVPETSTDATTETTETADTTVATNPPSTTAATTDPYYPPVPDDGVLTICLDPGHGFGDVGTDSEYLGDLTEKDITLSVVNLIKEKLTALGYNVILTHDGMTFPKTAIDDGNNLFRPQERISYVSELDIEFYLSIHCDNYTADTSVKGTRIYYSLGTDHVRDSGAAAKQLMNGIDEKLPNSKKAIIREMPYDSAYYVIRTCHVPSVLIEMGFVSNKTDAENMLSEEWRQTFAEGIANGLHTYFAQ
ncbi:MAG: N-acetylmuramoyl-L-alanine amidase [Clostridia bacterium]|nr:N-acetylmuramoyl-L-alanine amidase [Clostridia bacterium]